MVRLYDAGPHSTWFINLVQLSTGLTGFRCLRIHTHLAIAVHVFPWSYRHQHDELRVLIA